MIQKKKKKKKKKKKHQRRKLGARRIEDGAILQDGLA